MNFTHIDTRIYSDDLWIPSLVFRLSWPERGFVNDQYVINQSEDFINPIMHFSILNTDIYVSFWVRRSDYDYDSQISARVEVWLELMNRLTRSMVNYDTIIATLYANKQRLPISALPDELIREVIEKLPPSDFSDIAEILRD